MQHGILLLITFTAACMDIAHDKIDNSWIYVCWILGFGYQIGHYGFPGIANFFLGAVVPILLLYILFWFRMLGPGDIKLFSVLGGFMGPLAVMQCVGYSFLLGAILSIAFIFLCGNLFSRLWYFANYIHNLIFTKTVTPYYLPGKRLENIHFSVPIFMGVILYAGGIYG